MSEVETDLSEKLDNYRYELPPDTLTRTGKINRGENYRNLPYVVLDYPRNFENNQVFLFRTLFWWGNYFVCSLVLQGKWLNKYRPRILMNLSRNFKDDWYISSGDSPWENYLEQDHISLKNMERFQLRDMLQKDHFKLSRKLPLKKWKLLPSFAVQTLDEFLHLLK